MESVVLKSLKKKEQKLKKEEKKVIEAKAQFIMSHSKELIENIELSEYNKLKKVKNNAKS